MLTLPLFTLSYPRADSTNHIIVCPTGDTLLELVDSRVPKSPSTATFSFLVSPTTLRHSCCYFSACFLPTWCAPRHSDGKYHFSFSGDDFGAIALYIVLLTTHQPFSARIDDGARHGNIGLPMKVSLQTLADILWVVEFFQFSSASDLIAGSSAKWFEQFLSERDGEWDLPRDYGDGIMLFYCLARCFQPTVYSRNCLSLQFAAERIISRYRGEIDGCGWPVRSRDLEDLEERRDWMREYQMDMEE